MRALGIILLLIGVALLFVSCNMITSVGGYHNIGLISNRNTLSTVAAAITIIGALFYIFNRTQAPNSGRVKCPLCAEDISAEATLCKHCHSVVPANNQTTAAKVTPPKKPLIRDGLNATYSVNIATTKPRELMHQIIYEELAKVNKDINPETLMVTKHGFINLEATLQEQQNNGHRLLINYVAQQNFKISFILSTLLIIGYFFIQDALLILHGGLLGAAISTHLYFDTKSTTKKIITATQNAKTRSERS